MQSTPLGYRTACQVLAAGRGAFFGGVDIDLPERQTAFQRKDDLLPQFGYVGADYSISRVLLLGINPGNGQEMAEESAADQTTMSSKLSFVQAPSVKNFVEAEANYKSDCQTWHLSHPSSHGIAPRRQRQRSCVHDPRQQARSSIY
jgi:hypothetical protein